LSYLAGGSVWIVVMIVHSKITFGTLLPPYLWSSHVESGRLAGELLLSSYPEAVLGTLLSPGRGLFVYLPFLVVVIGLILRSWNWVPDRKLAWTAIGACIAHWQLVSLFRNWWGGQSFGPRLMSDLIPWFFLLNVFAAVAAQDAVRAGALRWRRRSTVAVLLTVALAVFVNVRGAWVQEPGSGIGAIRSFWRVCSSGRQGRRTPGHADRVRGPGP
jgi:hypothetical protein